MLKSKSIKKKIINEFKSIKKKSTLGKEILKLFNVNSLVKKVKAIGSFAEKSVCCCNNSCLKLLVLLLVKSKLVKSVAKGKMSSASKVSVGKRK